MIQEYAGDAVPGRWPHAGGRAFSRCCDEIGQTASAAHPSQLEDKIGSRWLTLAAEMAGLISGSRWPAPDSASTGPAGLPLVATRSLGADAGSIRAARDFAVATLHRWGTAERSQDIAIVVSELLTNAQRHALPGSGGSRTRRPIRLGLLQPGSCVLCAVADPSRTAPVLQARGSLAETGRGLHIICALSDQWGFTPSDTGKVVWAMFAPQLTLQPLSIATSRIGRHPLPTACCLTAGATSHQTRRPNPAAKPRDADYWLPRWYRGSSNPERRRHRSPDRAIVSSRHRPRALAQRSRKRSRRGRRRG